MLQRIFKLVGACVICALCGVAVVTHAQNPNWLAGKDLVNALRQGGYVLVMRHASSPRTLPTKETADRDNTKLERQLDDTGRNTAKAMGEALRKLNIPIGRVLVSPTYRARLTANLAGLHNAQAVEELGESSQGMQGADIGQANWLRAQAIQPPEQRTNTVMITHYPNIVAAFGKEWSDLKDGEALVFRPDGKGSVIAVARIKIEEWPMLANAG